MSYFHEEQSFGPWLFWTLVAVVGIPVAFLAVESLFRPVPFVPSLIAIAIFIPIALVFFAARLVVDVTRDEIAVSFHLLWPTRHIPLASVERATAEWYNPLWDYGGWGVRYAFANGWSFNTGGHNGVLVRTTDGKRVMIGSRRAKELEVAIAKAVAARAV